MTAKFEYGDTMQALLDKEDARHKLPRPHRHGREIDHAGQETTSATKAPQIL